MKRFFSLLAALAIGSLLSAQEFDGHASGPPGYHAHELPRGHHRR